LSIVFTQVAAKKINLVEAGAPQGDISEKFQDLRREVMLMRHASSPPLISHAQAQGILSILDDNSGLKHPNTVRLKGICLSPLTIITEFLSEVSAPNRPHTHTHARARAHTHEPHTRR
jgi:hypothetical protein